MKINTLIASTAVSALLIGGAAYAQPPQEETDMSKAEAEVTVTTETEIIEVEEINEPAAKMPAHKAGLELEKEVKTTTVVMEDDAEMETPETTYVAEEETMHVKPETTIVKTEKIERPASAHAKADVKTEKPMKAEVHKASYKFKKADVLFESMDMNGDNVISKDEFAEWQGRPASYTPQMSEYDENGDDKIRLKEVRDEVGK